MSSEGRPRSGRGGSSDRVGTAGIGFTHLFRLSVIVIGRRDLKGWGRGREEEDRGPQALSTNDLKVLKMFGHFVSAIIVKLKYLNVNLITIIFVSISYEF